MPLLALSEDQVITAMNSGASDLKWLLADCDVGNDAQAVLFHLGFTKIRVFVGLGETRAEVKEAIKSDMGLDPAEGAGARVSIACLLSAWDAARLTATQELKAKAEHKASEVARPVAQQELTALRLAFETRYYKLDPREIPSKSYLGLKQEEIDENEPRAETLKEVTSREDHESSYLTADISADGQIKVKKGVKDGSMPSNSEELRAKHKLIGNCWLFLKLRHTNRPWLSDVDERTFVLVSDYLLGKHVQGIVVTASGGRTHHVPWPLVLSYELEVRRRAYDLVCSGDTMGAALKKTMEDSSHRERYFLAPFTLGASSPSPVPPPSTGAQRTARTRWAFQPYGKAKGKGRGKGPKGKGKGKGPKGGTKGQGHHKYSVTEDNKPICFRWNDSKNRDNNCGRIHICSWCRGTHARMDCRDAPNL